MPYKKLAIILGNCLFPNHDILEPDEQTLFFMAEDTGLCTHFRYHKHKLTLFLSAMRSHKLQIERSHPVAYWELDSGNQLLSYEDKLKRTLEEHSSIEELVTYDIEDKFFDRQLRQFARNQNITLTIVSSPGFLTTRDEFQEYVDSTRKPFMAKFYQQQRRKLNALVTENGEPLHGKWSFDEDNRKKLPKDISIPELPSAHVNKHTEAVMNLVNELFPDHPGSTDNFYWATTRESALKLADRFFEERFNDFGPYEDAIDSQEVHIFHSVLSPYINMGMLTPEELLDKALDAAQQHNIHYASVEGYVRQIIGWREFMRGMYHTHNLEGNHFGFKRKMKPCWYDGTTGIPPLDDSIKKANEYAYVHHIERLMILGNIMLLSELDPDEVYKWFMELFIDSADWVMVPNVYGMSQFADGGTFATKPYIGGSNYIAKMSNYKKSKEWSDIVDGLYWRFIDRQRNLFGKNPRMSMMTSTFDKMKADKKERILGAAEEFLERVTA